MTSNRDWRSVCQLISAVVLLLFYCAVAGLAVSPNVSAEYESFYINETDSTWEGSSTSYTYGTVWNFTTEPPSDHQAVGQHARGWSHPAPSFRWTSGETASLVFTPNSSADAGLVLRFRALAAIPENSPQGVSIRVNDNHIRELSIGTSEWNTYSVDIPESDVPERGQTMNVTFVIDDPVRPSEVSDSPDDRRLGLAVQWLTIEEKQR